MSAIPRPVKVEADLDNGTSLLYFPRSTEEDDVNPNAPHDGRYYMRGGCCWPGSLKSNAPGSSHGFLVLGGLNTETQKLYIFEETSFLTIEHVVDPEGRMEREGACLWFKSCWENYFASTYYRGCDDERHWTYFLQAVRCPMIERGTTHFVEAPIEDPRQALHIIEHRLELQRLFYRAEGELFAHLQRYRVQPEHPEPAVWALMCLVAGLERHPFRERDSTPPKTYERLVRY